MNIFAQALGVVSSARSGFGNRREKNRRLGGLLALLVWFTASCSGTADKTLTPLVEATQTEISPAAVTDTPPAAASTARLPDLTITKLTIETPASNPCLDFFGRMRLQVEVSNLGNEVSDSFVVDMNGQQLNALAGLAPGAAATLVFTDVPDLARIAVDANDQVVESNETNNLFVNSLTPPPLPLQCLVRPTPMPITRQPAARLETGASTGVPPETLDLAFSPDGSVLATGSTDNALRLWRIQNESTLSANLLRVMQGHPFPVLSIAYSPSGALIATGSSDYLVRLWRVSDGALLNTLSGHSDWVTHLAFSPDERYLASAGRDFTVRLWRMVTGRLQTTIDEGMAELTDLVYSPDGFSLAWSESNSTIRIYNLSRSRWQHILPFAAQEMRPSPATSLAFSRDGSMVFGGYADGHIRAWGTSNGELVMDVPVHNGKITCLDAAPNQRWIVFGTENGSLQLWYLDSTATNLERELVFQGHSGKINQVVFSPNGAMIASASDDGSVILWNTPEEQVP